MNTNFEQTQTNECEEEAFDFDWRSVSLDEIFEKNTVDGKCIAKWFGVNVPEYANADKYHCFVIQEDEEDVKFWLCIKKSYVTGKEMTLTVLGRHIGMVIGRGGENIKRIAKALGLRYIKVEKIF